MSEELQCYRCGNSLAALSLPLSRQDECPSCHGYLHVCRMCVFYDPQVPRGCREDDAEEVIEKERLNFCEWWQPAAAAFDAKRFGDEQLAKSQFAALFGEEDAPAQESDPRLSDAEDLFK